MLRNQFVHVFNIRRVEYKLSKKLDVLMTYQEFFSDQCHLYGFDYVGNIIPNFKRIFNTEKERKKGAKRERGRVREREIEREKDREEKRERTVNE